MLVFVESNWLMVLLCQKNFSRLPDIMLRVPISNGYKVSCRIVNTSKVGSRGKIVVERVAMEDACAGGGVQVNSWVLIEGGIWWIDVAAPGSLFNGLGQLCKC